MGKSRRQNTKKETHRDETNSLKDIIRKQQKEIQVLRKELHRKFSTMTIETQEDSPLEPQSNATKPRCEKCNNTDIYRLVLGIRTLIKCRTCNHSKTEKTKE